MREMYKEKKRERKIEESIGEKKERWIGGDRIG
jgi:hypothetical protein